MDLKPWISLLVCSLVVFSQDDTPSITQITLDAHNNFTGIGYTYSYYSLTFNATKPLLLITASTEANTFFQIFASISLTNETSPIKYPNQSAYTIECSQRSMDTCVLRLQDNSHNRSVELLNKEVTVYFSVVVFQDTLYQLMTTLDDIYDVKIGRVYSVSFSNYESGLIRLNGSETIGVDQILIIATYNTSAPAGKVSILAAKDIIPTSDYSSKTHSSEAVGAFNRIVRLPPISADSAYFILIQGETGTKLNLQIKPSSPSSGVLAMNSTEIYTTHHDKTYIANLSFPDADFKPLYLQMNALVGYGLFNINYCEGLSNFTFQNVNGEYGQIGISSAERLACMKKMKNQSTPNQSTPTQNLKVVIDHTMYHFGYEVGLYEGSSMLNMINLNEQKFGMMLAEESGRKYNIQLQSSESATYNLTFQPISNSSGLTVGVEACQKSILTKMNCTNITTATSINSDKITLNFTTKNTTSNISYNIFILSNNTTTVEYLLEVINANQTTKQLLPNKIYLDLVELNQYKYYCINLTAIKQQQQLTFNNYTQVNIFLKEINGDVAILSSLQVAQPTYDLLYQNGSDVLYTWNGKVNYLINATTDAIYFSVMSYSQSLYSLQVTIHIDADIAIRYLRLTDDTENHFELSANQNHTYQLVMFASHSIPYKISITSNPECIRYGYSLPLPTACATSLPSQYTQKVVYFNISNGALSPSNNFKFSMYVSSGSYVLTEKNPILVACVATCYEMISVQLSNASINIIHRGRGGISQMGNSYNNATESYLTLSCEKYPCSKELNASLYYGGQMTVYQESNNNIEEIEWLSKPMTFGNYPKKLIYNINRYSNVNTFMLYSSAVRLDIYYSLIQIHEDKTNLINYEFPTNTNFERKSSVNPLRGLNVIEIDNELINNKRCRVLSNLCVVVVSVYPNIDVQYNEAYLLHGVGYFSSNTYQQTIALDTPYQISQDFSLSYFTHQQHQSENYIDSNYTIQIQPISNCHPQIYTGLSYKNPTPLHPSYSSANVQYINSWINFTVFAESSCKYYVTLSSSNYTNMIQNLHEILHSENGSITFVYRSTYSFIKTFEIRVFPRGLQSTVQSILVNRINSSSSNSWNLPGTVADYSIKNANALTINGESYQLYLVRILTKSAYMDVLVQQNNQPIIVLHNTLNKQLFNQNKTSVSYKIYSTGSVMLYINARMNTPHLIVNKNYNQTTVLNRYLTSMSFMYHIQAHEHHEVVEYDITIVTNAEQYQLEFLFQEDDALAYPMLYEGIPQHDAFTSFEEVNCYQHHTPMLVGRSTLIVDFVMDFEGMCDCNCHFGSVELMYKAFTQSGVVASHIEKLKNASGLVYRLHIEFIPLQNYTICFYSPNITLLAKEYYILLNSAEMAHLPKGYSSTQVRTSQYDLYEIIQEGQSENILVQLISCNGMKNSKMKSERLLLGSSSFENAELGRFTQLYQYYKNDDSIVAKMTVSEGFYYLGVKNAQNSDNVSQYDGAYKIRTQHLSNDAPILANNWKLNNNQIMKIYTSQKEEDILNIELPLISTLKSSREVNQTNIRLTYTLFVMNHTHNNTIPMNVITRCPNYNKLMASTDPMHRTFDDFPTIGKFTQQNTYQNVQQYISQAHSPIIFHLSTKNLTFKFTVSAQVDVQVNGQIFSYFYEPSKVKIQGSGVMDEGGVSVLFVVLLIVTILGLAAGSGYLLFMRWRKKKEALKVAFEMANFDYAGEGEKTQRRQNKQALNKNTGYGQFVDETI